MEAKLFLVAMWCGLYGLILRGGRRRGIETQRWFPILTNGLFWGTAAILAGMLIASYRNMVEFGWQGTLIYFAVGFVLGCAWGAYRTRNEENSILILRDNLEWADTGFSAILLASVFMFFVIQAFKIPSGSMRMTFVEGDHLFVNKFIYGIRIPFTDKKLFRFKEIENGDIVIFRFPAKDEDNAHFGKDFIKRVVAVGGQTVEIKNKVVYVDGEEVDEPYAQHVEPHVYQNPYGLEPAEYQRRWVSGGFAHMGPEIRDNFGPVTVPSGYLLVLGDNRDRSYDSRFWGPLPAKTVKGKAWLRYWGPLDPDLLEEKPWIRFWIPARFRLVR